MQYSKRSPQLAERLIAPADPTRSQYAVVTDRATWLAGLRDTQSTRNGAEQHLKETVQTSIRSYIQVDAECSGVALSKRRRGQNIAEGHIHDVRYHEKAGKSSVGSRTRLGSVRYGKLMYY